MPVEDEDGGAGAFVEGRLGEDVHPRVDEPDEHHRGVHLAVAAAHGGYRTTIDDGASTLLLCLVPAPELS